MSEGQVYQSLWYGLIRGRRPMAGAGTGDPRPPGGLVGLLSSVAADHGLSIRDLESESRRGPVVRARQEFMWRARAIRWSDGGHRYSLPMIGDFLGRDHTTVLHGVRRHQGRLEAEGYTEDALACEPAEVA
jgi:hypothetical protein